MRVINNSKFLVVQKKCFVIELVTSASIIYTEYNNKVRLTLICICYAPYSYWEARDVSSELKLARMRTSVTGAAPARLTLYTAVL